MLHGFFGNNISKKETIDMVNNISAKTMKHDHWMMQEIPLGKYY